MLKQAKSTLYLSLTGKVASLHPLNKYWNSIKLVKFATQYVDFDGIASMDSRFNPNQSVAAIEGIYSPDGRVFGKMAHSERCGTGISKNIPGLLEMPILVEGKR